MKINWKARFKQRPFLIAGFSFFLLFASEVASLMGYDIKIYNGVITQSFELILFILVGFGVVNDPTTAGVSDSKRAMLYKEPRDDK